MKREIYYDLVRGFAILLVVFGHAIQGQDMDYGSNPLFLAIYIFHMPLFAYLSGLFFVRSYEHYAPFELIKRRFVQLMVPCLAWGTLIVAMAVAGKILHHKPMDYVYFFGLLTNGLWYLSAIFGLVVIGVVVHSLARRLSGGGGVYHWMAPRLPCPVFHALLQVP